MFTRRVSTLRQFTSRLFLFQGGLLGLEQNQAFVRFAITVVAVTYVFSVYFYQYWPAPLSPTLIVLIGYFIFTIINIIICLRATKHSVTRRLIATFSDVFIVSILMIELDKYGVPLAGLYLWLIIGTGLRYGVKPMMLR